MNNRRPVAIFVALLVLSVLTSVSIPAVAGDGCSSKELESVFQAIAAASSREDQLEFAARGIGLACEMPAGLEEAADAFGAAPPDQRELLVLRGVTTEIATLMPVCTNPAKALLEWNEAAPADKVRVAAKNCDLSGIATDEELGTAERGTFWFGLAVYAWLQSKNNPDARKVARLLMGIGLPEPRPLEGLPEFQAVPELERIEPIRKSK